MDIKYVNLGLFYVEADDGRSGVVTTMIDEFGDSTDEPGEAVACVAEVEGIWFALDLRQYQPMTVQ